MIVWWYCGFNGFGQYQGTDPESPIEKKDICEPTKMYETTAPSMDVQVSLSWSRLVIVDNSKAMLSGFWNGISSFKGIISEGEMRQIVCSESLAVGIDKNGKLKKLLSTEIIKSCHTSDLNCSLTATRCWEDALVDSNSGSDNVKCENQVQPTLKFVKVASNQHCIVAVDEFGSIHMPPLRIETADLSPNIKFVDVVCGKEHFVALTSNGEVYTWGSGSRGQLGHGSIESIDCPQRVEVLGGIKIIQIAAGDWHTFVLGDASEVYAWGWNESGQLGLPCRNISGTQTSDPVSHVSVQSDPRLLDVMENVISISCGSRHTAVTLADRSGWAWGWNGCGQLGTGNRKSSDSPVCVIQNVDSVVCRAWSTAWLSKCC